MTTIDRIPAAALVALIILQSVMLAALYAGVAPHPPAASITLFAIAPFLGVALSVAVAALILGAGSNGIGRTWPDCRTVGPAVLRTAKVF
jgi:hypothetical protein